MRYLDACVKGRRRPYAEANRFLESVGESDDDSKNNAEPALLVLPHGDPQNRLGISSMRPIATPA